MWKLAGGVAFGFALLALTAPPVLAGQLNHSAVTVTWEDQFLVVGEPFGCSDLRFYGTRTNTPPIAGWSVSLTNPAGERKWASDGVIRAVCPGSDWVGVPLTLKVSAHDERFQAVGDPVSTVITLRSQPPRGLIAVERIPCGMAAVVTTYCSNQDVVIVDGANNYRYGDDTYAELFRNGKPIKFSIENINYYNSGLIAKNSDVLRVKKKDFKKGDYTYIITNEKNPKIKCRRSGGTWTCSFQDYTKNAHGWSWKWNGQKVSKAKRLSTKKLNK